MSELSSDTVVPGLPSEKRELEQWQTILTQSDITVDKIANFCRNNIKLVESQWKNTDNSTLKNERLIILHTVYASILDLISSPSAEKENLIKYLQDLLDK